MAFKDKAAQQAWYEAHKEREQERSKAWYHANKAQAQRNNKRSKRKRRYNITEEATAALFSAQGSKCAICGSDKSGTERDWHVDHDHTTGTVRGILCHHCNLLLGNARDSEDTLSSAIQYLRNHHGNDCGQISCTP